MSKPPVAERRQSRPATAGRFARIMRLLRWPVVIVWLLAVVALYPAAHTLSSLANGTAAANLPSSAPSTRVVELEQGPGQPDVDTAIVMFVREAGLTAADLQTVASARAAVARLATHVQGLGAPGQPQRSADGKAAEFTANVTTPTGGDSEFNTDTTAVRAIRQAVDGLARGGLQVAVTGSAALVADGGVSSTGDAMAAALRRTLPTLLASAGTVVCAMICLLAAQSASLHGLGPVGAVSIVAALLAQITFLPALLLVLGRTAFWPRIPRDGQPGRESSRVWTGVGNRVARHPARVAAAAVVLLGAAATGMAALHINNSPLADIKGHPASVTGANLLTEHYGPGVTEPLTILSPPGQASAAVAAARATPDIAAVSPSGPVHGYASYSATLSVPPYSTAGYAACSGWPACCGGTDSATTGSRHSCRYTSSSSSSRSGSTTTSSWPPASARNPPASASGRAPCAASLSPGG
jgi:uncharacterized membrane protein YdfJ with MMPL/SSD domain